MVGFPLHDKKSTAVVFVTDLGFVVPSLVAALQILGQANVRKNADVLIVLVDFEAALSTQIEATFSQEALVFVSMSATSFIASEQTFRRSNHVPLTTLARLALHEVIPEHYENIVYIDGDVQIIGDLTPLVSHQVEEGHIAAVTEATWLCRDDLGSFWPAQRAYMKGIGINDPHEYFNAGVLAFRMSTWREKAPQALKYFFANQDKCLCHDQSALNAVFKGHRQVLSPRYNYSTLYASLGLNEKLSPALIHFTGGHKPWFYPGKPWLGRFIDVYAEFTEKYSFLSPYLRRPSAESIAETMKKQRTIELKGRVLAPWRSIHRRRALVEYMSESKFAFE